MLIWLPWGGGQVRGQGCPPSRLGCAHPHAPAPGSHLQQHVRQALRGEEHVSPLALRVQLVAEGPPVGRHLEVGQGCAARPAPWPTSPQRA